MKNAGWIVAAIAVLALIGFGFAAYQNNGPTSDNATSTTPGTPPSPTPGPAAGAPTAETGTEFAVSNSTAVVTGRVNPNGAQTTYWYDYGTTNSLGSTSKQQTIGSSYSNIPAPGYITGLRPSTKYFYRLAASNVYGSDQGEIFTFTTHATNPPPPGDEPTVQTSAATDVGRSSATLNGRINPNGAQAAYWFEYGQTQRLGSVTDFKSAGAGASNVDVSATLSRLAAGTKYYFRLNAQNKFGTDNGPIMSFTTTGTPVAGEPIVETLDAINITSSTVTLQGTLNPNGSQTTYWFEYSTDTLLGSLIGTATEQKTDGSGFVTATVTADLSNLSANTKYFFRVVARNDAGTARGENVTFRTKP